MNIGVVCYASVGGSGIVATELAKALARHGHQVHLISTEPPFRLGDYEAGLAFHRVHTPTYPLFRGRSICCRWRTSSQLRASRSTSFTRTTAFHATAAYLAKQILAATTAALRHVPKVITTLHGTDITLLAATLVFGNRRLLDRSVGWRHRGIRACGATRTRHR
jgi:hypothetical protein